MKLLIVFVLAIATVRAATLEGAFKATFATSRIINGKDAAAGEAPYIVSLKKSQHFCGGSIISDHWVLTAGHCLVYDSFKVVAGLHSRSDESQVQIREVPSKAYQIAHEKYDGNVGPNDIGLIYIATPFKLGQLNRDGNAVVAAISLPVGNYDQSGDGTLYGWGKINAVSLPNNLQKIDVKIISYSQCKKELPLSAPLEDVNICSYNAGTTDGACSGDSGGPLIRTTSGGAEQVGIVSWGYTPCVTSEYPSVYTSVSAYNGWISDQQKNYVAPKF